jgi:hypothetical protein
MTLLLGSFDESHPAVETLKNGQLGDVNVTDSRPPVPTFAYATINVSGHSAFTGTIGSTAMGFGLRVNLPSPQLSSAPSRSAAARSFRPSH